MAQQQEQRPRRRRRPLAFEASTVFRPSKAEDDLAFDLDREAAQYRARKGQGGNRAPPADPSTAGPGPRGRRWTF